MTRSLAFLVFTAALVANTAAAGDLIYRPVNPAFGGPSNNVDYLLGTAQLQNKHPASQGGGGGGGGGGVPNISFPDISIDLGGAVSAPATTAPLNTTPTVNN